MYDAILPPQNSCRKETWASAFTVSSPFVGDSCFGLCLRKRCFTWLMVRARSRPTRLRNHRIEGIRSHAHDLVLAGPRLDDPPGHGFGIATRKLQGGTSNLCRPPVAITWIMTTPTASRNVFQAAAVGTAHQSFCSDAVPGIWWTVPALLGYRGGVT